MIPLSVDHFLKLNKEYAKLRKYKKKQFRQDLLDQIDNFHANNPKEYWNLVNTLRETKKDKPRKVHR